MLPTSLLGQHANAHPIFVDGQAQLVPAFQDSTQWIHEELWVETEFDSDHDGKRDRVHVDVTRPQQTASEGLKVPVIYESSPYYAGVIKTADWDVEQELGAASPARSLASTASTAPSPKGNPVIAMSFVRNWVPRGFAVVHSESPGTGMSQGCPTIGGSNEALAPKAVVDWLNGRARGFTTVDGDQPVIATWSTGKVGMIGTSYNGFLALAAATTGVDGLAAVVPVSGVSSWYNYYRANGLVRSPGGYLGEDMDPMFDAINTGSRSAFCAATIRDSVLTPREDRVSGDYNDFWAERDYVAKVDHIKAAVLIAHGFNDWNVMPDQGLRVYEALRKRNMPVQAFLHQGGHGGNPPLTQLNRWFTRYLYDVHNDVEHDPHVQISNDQGNSTTTPYAEYPNPATQNVTFYPQAGGVGIGGLGTTKSVSNAQEMFVDDVSVTRNVAALVWAEHDDQREAQSDAHRLVYATPVLEKDVHLSGWPTVDIQMSSSKPAANLSVYLVAMPSTPDSSATRIITRGWADPQNSHSLTHGEALVPGQFYTVHFNLEPQDRIIPAGMRLGLVIFSSAHGFTLWPSPGTKLTIDTKGTSITLPLVGGAKAL